MERAIKKNGQEYRSFIGRKRLFVFALLVFTVLVFLFAIAFGSSTVPLNRVIATLFGHGVQKENIIVLNLRLPRAVTEQVEIRLKYDGYIKRQLRQVEDFARMEAKKLPPDLDYAAIAGLRLEAREKLEKIRPENFGQASRISGVSPADISVLMVYMETKT